MVSPNSRCWSYLKRGLGGLGDGDIDCLRHCGSARSRSKNVCVDVEAGRESREGVSVSSPAAGDDDLASYAVLGSTIGKAGFTPGIRISRGRARSFTVQWFHHSFIL